MTPLGDLLELMHNADSLSTFEGDFRDWLRPLSPPRLVVYAEDTGVGRLRFRGPGPFPHRLESRRRIWAEQPHRIRVELTHGSELEQFGIRNRDRWWRWDRAAGVTVGRVDGPSASPPSLLDPLLLSPARLIGWLRFEPTGSAVRLGREVVLARARPRNVLPDVELALDFEIDSEHGVVLRRAAAENGRYVQVTEALDVHFNRPIDPRRFVFAEATNRRRDHR